MWCQVGPSPQGMARAAEVKRAANGGAFGEGDRHLDDIGIVALARVADRRHQGGDIDRQGSASGRERRPHQGGIERRQIALQVDDDIVAAIGIDVGQGLEDAIGAGRVIGIGQHRPPAGDVDGVRDLPLGAGDDHRADVGLDGAPPDMHDHRLAVDVGQRLAGQAGRRHAGGHDDDGTMGLASWSAPIAWTHAAMPELTRQDVEEIVGLRLLCEAQYGRSRPGTRRVQRMHFSLLEKLGGAALIVAWVVYGANFLGDSLVDQQRHAAVGIAGGAEQAAAAAPAEQAAAPVDFNALLKTADAAAGEKVFGKCKACHTIEKGGANGVGPNLYNVVGGPKAHIAGVRLFVGPDGDGDARATNGATSSSMPSSPAPRRTSRAPR